MLTYTYTRINTQHNSINNAPRRFRTSQQQFHAGSDLDAATSNI